MKVCWERVIRFVSDNGRILKGEPLLPSDEYQLGRESEPKNLRARVIVGDDIFSESGACHVSDETVSVKRLLSPLAAEEVPILRCVGLNYVKHSMYLYSGTAMVLSICSPRSTRSVSSTVSFNLLQAQHNYQ